MTVTAIVVMNQENKLTTTKNPLLRVKEVEDYISTYTKDSVVFVDSEQHGLRIQQCVGSREVFSVVDPVTGKDIVGVENIHPKSAELLIKHYYNSKVNKVVMFLSPSQLDRVKGFIDQVVMITINNPSKETAIVSRSFLDSLAVDVARKKLTITTWSARQSEESHKRRYVVKIYS